ncbi:Glucose-induced degradation protein 8 homolog, partial [Linum perenne]
IFQYALEGNALKAIELTEQLAPDLLEKNQDLHFDILSLNFVELVYSRKCHAALKFAQAKLTQFGKMQKYVEKLEVCSFFLVIITPSKSIVFQFGVDCRTSWLCLPTTRSSRDLQCLASPASR